jgi:DNA (cytosine-5)-methyltransferase 1
MSKKEVGFLFFYDWLEPFSLLSGDEFKKLFISMAEYQLNGTKHGEFTGNTALIASFVFPQLDRRMARSEAGKKGMAVRWSENEKGVNNKNITQDKNKDKDKYNLLYEFGRLVKEVHPDIVTMENVPAIASFKLKSVLTDFVEVLQNEGYNVKYKVVYCPDYGIPQTRKRLVLLASRLGNIDLISPTHKKENYVTVKDAIGHLPPLKAGQGCPADALHRCRALSPLNLQRLKSTPYGGSWKDWPADLMLECHKKESGKSFGSVYGRMVWEEPSPTMTTLCTGIGNGRFGHPVQNRAISAREAALFQTFPITYKFFPNEHEVSLTKASRYIGNAVPPKLGEVIAQSIKNHIEDLKNKA